MSQLSKVLYRCRRGTKELDMLTQKYAQQHFLQASAKEQNRFIELLELQDPELYHLLVDQQTFDDELVKNIVEKIRAPAR